MDSSGILAAVLLMKNFETEAEAEEIYDIIKGLLSQKYSPPVSEDGIAKPGGGASSLGGKTASWQSNTTRIKLEYVTNLLDQGVCRVNLAYQKPPNANNL